MSFFFLYRPYHWFASNPTPPTPTGPSIYVNQVRERRKRKKELERSPEVKRVERDFVEPAKAAPYPVDNLVDNSVYTEQLLSEVQQYQEIKNLLASQEAAINALMRDIIERERAKREIEAAIQAEMQRRLIREAQIRAELIQRAIKIAQMQEEEDFLLLLLLHDL